MIRTVYLRRNDAHQAAVEWDWSEKASDRFIFPTLDEAWDRVAALIAVGESHVHAAVAGELDERLRTDRVQRHARATVGAGVACRKIMSEADALARWEAKQDGE